MTYHVAPYRFHKERIARFLARNPDTSPAKLVGNIALFTSVACVIVVALLKEMGHDSEELRVEEQVLKAFYDAEVVE